MNNERDTHFANAAKLLFKKFMATRAMDTLDADRFLSDDEKAELQTLFAHFAYDLVDHACTNITGSMINWHIEDRVHAIPDLTEWPTLLHP